LLRDGSQLAAVLDRLPPLGGGGGDLKENPGGWCLWVVGYVVR